MAKQGEHGISWTEETWNPIRGCSRVSEGCQNCYAERVAARFSGKGEPYEGLARYRGENGPNSLPLDSRIPMWTGEVRFIKEHLDDPLRWKKPRRIFVNSMSDLFHEKLPDANIFSILAVMCTARHHQFQVLTKRPERMKNFLSMPVVTEKMSRLGIWPPPHIWWGVSVEDQETADERISLLLQTPAALRWVSYEPALGPVDFWRPRYETRVGELSSAFSWGQGVKWIVVGGESGPGARPMDIAWARRTVKDCKKGGAAVFVKQLGANVEWDGLTGPGEAWPRSTGSLDTGKGTFRKHLTDSKKGADMSEWPEDLRVREYPNV